MLNEQRLFDSWLFFWEPFAKLYTTLNNALLVLVLVL